MTLLGECVNAEEVDCEACGTHLKIEILRSNAGYYIGFLCPKCGPYSRESGYYRRYSDAEFALKGKSYWR